MLKRISLDYHVIPLITLLKSKTWATLSVKLKIQLLFMQANSASGSKDRFVKSQGFTYKELKKTHFFRNKTVQTNLNHHRLFIQSISFFKLLLLYCFCLVLYNRYNQLRNQRINNFIVETISDFKRTRKETLRTHKTSEH